MSKLREHSKVVSVTANSIKAIKRFVDGFDAEEDSDKVEFRIQRLDQLFEKYMAASIELELLMGEDDSKKPIDYTKERDDMEEQYYQIRDFLVSHKPAVNNSVAASPYTPVPSVVRLPKIDLPTFDGDIDGWIPFRDAYKSLIHNNAGLAAVDKFHYLMAALKGPVKKLLDTTSITAANYKIAWDLIVRRYDNKRLLIKNHISALFAIEPVRKECSDAILQLVDHFDRHVRILKTLGESTDTWSSLLVHMVCSRLDRSTLREWEKSTGDIIDEIPTYSDLVDFLHEQARILLSLNSGSTNPNPPILKEKPRLSVAHAATGASPSSNSCLVCNQPHRIYECDLFRNMSLDQKQETVRLKRLCWNCLSSSHVSRDCPSKPCRRCNEKHHTLLHPSSSNDRNPQTQQRNDSSTQPSDQDNVTYSPTLNPSAVLPQSPPTSHSHGQAPTLSQPQSTPRGQHYFPVGS